MNSRPTESGNQSFHLSRIHDTQIDLISGEVVLEIELELFHDDQKIFLGLMNTHRVNRNVYVITVRHCGYHKHKKW